MTRRNYSFAMVDHLNFIFPERTAFWNKPRVNYRIDDFPGRLHFAHIHAYK